MRGLRTARQIRRTFTAAGIDVAELYSVDSGTAALTAATAKTVIELSTGSTVTCRWKTLQIGCDTTSAGSLKIEIIVATSGTGTAYTPKKVNADAQNRAANATAKVLDSVEPTSVTVLQTFDVPLPTGGYLGQYMLALERYMPPSLMYGVRLTSTTVSPNAWAYLEFEE